MPTNWTLELEQHTQPVLEHWMRAGYLSAHCKTGVVDLKLQDGFICMFNSKIIQITYTKIGRDEWKEKLQAHEKKFWELEIIIPP